MSSLLSLSRHGAVVYTIICSAMAASLVLLIPWFIILAMRKISNLSTFSRQQCVKLRVHWKEKLE